jgi:uncharacterized RDD family membrane protein YckC
MAGYQPLPGGTMPWSGASGLPARALDGVRTRRMAAFALDLVLVGVMVAILWLVLIVFTLGLAIFFLPPLFPVVAFFYNGLSVSGPGRGTPGMRAFDLQMVLDDTGGRVPFLNAAVHGVMLYLSWMFPPVFLVSLLSSDKRCLHDILARVIVVRRW